MAGKPGGTGGIPNSYSQAKIGLALFNLKIDIGESDDVADKHPDIVKRMQKLADSMRDDLGDGNRKGKGRRQAGKL